LLKFLKSLFKKTKLTLSVEDLRLLDKHVFYYHQLSDDKKANKIRYKTAKIRFKMELKNLAIAMIVVNFFRP
tara:strand:+ start:3177 stop:3392 length:216 start_codon:yes stop_codon:yes gene_type:complete